MPVGTSVILGGISRTLHARNEAASSSAAASLGGKKALTPIIAGSVCGGLMIIAWIIGFAIYFRKRYNRKKRNRLIAEGKAAPREKDLEQLKEKVVIPPDPAVLLGQRQPGEHVFPERHHSKDGKIPWSRRPSHERSKSHTSKSGGDRVANNIPPSETTSVDEMIVHEEIVPRNIP